MHSIGLSLVNDKVKQGCTVPAKTLSVNLKYFMKQKIKTLFLFIVFTGLTAFTSEDNKPRIFLIGDSTMANKKPEAAPETGWGMIFPKYIDTEINNHAVNG